MSRMKTIFAVLVLTAIVGVVPKANAAPSIKVVIAGSSAQWQSLALAAYRAGLCVSGGTAPCAHYTGVSKFNLNDTRPTSLGGVAAVDTGNTWIVWDNVTADPTCASCHVWIFTTVDSVVGNRCYFANPACNINVGAFPAVGNLISNTVWGDGSNDTLPPANVQNLFLGATGPQVNVAATDIRPEDALFAQCRVNSAQGGGSDGLAGLGYGVKASGVCAAFGDPLATVEGTPIKSGYPGSGSKANVLAFNISGKDPFTNLAVPKYTTDATGAAPIVFVTNRTAAGGMLNVANATDTQLQTVFGGVNCSASVFAGGGANNIAVYLREPLSGTENTTESTVFRYPVQGGGVVSGVSQETGVNAANPLANLPCNAGGARWRGIGTGQEVQSVQNSNLNNGLDGIGYTFFSYGNVNPISNQAAYGYLTLDGVDPIFAVYGAGGSVDPGQPAGAGVIPAAANLPAACGGAFPCAENKIWVGQLSFPNLRTGAYRAWSLLRVVSFGTPLTNAKLLVTGAQKFNVTSVPDFVPAIAVTGTPSDPGLKILRSHYTQEGIAPVNSGTGEKGGDMGGCIEVGGSTVVKMAQNYPYACVAVP
jgi:hypothetical protein